MNRNIWELPLTATKTTLQSPGQLGELRYENGNIYRLVKNWSGVTLNQGDVVFHGTTGTVNGSITDDLAMKTVYTEGQATAGTSLALMGGVVVAATIAALDYGWVQVAGLNATVKIKGDGTAVAVGDSLKGVSAHVYVVQGAAVGTAPLYRRQLIALEAATDANTTAHNVLVQCL